MKKYVVTVMVSTVRFIDAETEEQAKEIALKDSKECFEMEASVVAEDFEDKVAE